MFSKNSIKSEALGVATSEGFFCAGLPCFLLPAAVQPLADTIIQIIADQTCCDRYKNRKYNLQEQYTSFPVKEWSLAAE